MRRDAPRAILVRLLLVIVVALSFAAPGMAAEAVQSGLLQNHAPVAGVAAKASVHQASSQIIHHGHDGASSCNNGMTCAHCGPLPMVSIVFLVTPKETHEQVDSEGASSFCKIPHRPPNLA